MDSGLSAAPNSDETGNLDQDGTAAQLATARLSFKYDPLRHLDSIRILRIHRRDSSGDDKPVFDVALSTSGLEIKRPTQRFHTPG